MTDEELDKLKAEIAFHKHCKPCRNCGECERILDIALKEKQEAQGEPRPCKSCLI